MKTRQTSVAASTTPATRNINSSAPSQAAMTSSSPTEKNRQTGDQKRARYRQARNLPEYQRDINIKKVKIEKQGGAADIQQAPKPDGRWDKFTKALTAEGQLILRYLDYDERSELIAWLRTSPVALRELVIADSNMGDTHTIALASALQVNTTITKLDLSSNNIGPEGAKELAGVLQVNKTITELDLHGNHISNQGAKALAVALEVNKTVTKLKIGHNKIWDQGALLLAHALKVNTTITELDLSDNYFGVEGAKALAIALRGNSTLRMLDLFSNQIYDAGARALITALEDNTTLTTLGIGTRDVDDQTLRQKIHDLLERNKQQLQDHAEASIDLIYRHSPIIRYVGLPTDLIPVFAKQLPNEVLAVFDQEWRDAFPAPPPPVTTTTTNATVTTTTTTTTESTIPTTLTTSSAPIVTSPVSVPPPSTQPTATAADINALLADPNPVAALSRWIDGHANPTAALNWVDPSNGYTLLHYAVAAQEGAVVRSLLTRGIDRTRADQNNQTAAQLAQRLADSSSSSTVAAIAALFK